jgi:tetratricopeptide (TPR) repeat protein
LAAFERATATYQGLVDTNPAVTQFQHDLAASHVNMGVALAQLGRVAEAAAAHGRSVAIAQKLVDDNPAVTQFRGALANSLNETGDVLRSLGRAAQARASYERAVGILEDLVTADGGAAQEQCWLLQGLKGLGAVQLVEGRTADAVVTWRRAVAIGDHLQNPYGEMFYFLAGCHAGLGRAAGVPGSGLLAAVGPAELDRAMDLLRHAVAAGYHPVGWMRRDPDLDPLRGRQDFQLLLRDLMMPDDPFAG